MVLTHDDRGHVRHKPAWQAGVLWDDDHVKKPITIMLRHAEASTMDDGSGCWSLAYCRTPEQGCFSRYASSAYPCLR